ncbi:MAG: hypothetical protein ABID67_00985 [Candidatus Nealsonbacteria bacterium]
MKKTTLFIIIAAVLVGALGIYYYQKNIYSKDVIKLEILGPVETGLLEEVEYVVKYKNNGDTRLEEPELIFEYPKYSIPVGEDATRVTKDENELGGAIYPGEERTISFKARLLGKEGDIKTAKVSLSYKPKDLRARYESSTSFTTLLGKVPLTLEFDLPTNIESGKEIKFKINYFSNANYPLSDLRILLDSPSNFEFVKSNPISLEDKEWEIGLLNKADGGRVEITGKMMGGVGEESILRARLGSWYDGEFVLLKEAIKGISIIKPTLYITQNINNNPEFAVDPGDSLHYEIFFKNIGEDILTDMTLQITLSGSALDFNTLRTIDGQYEEGDNSILWDWRRVSDLQLISPQEEGRVEFWINAKNSWNINSTEDKNPEIKTKVYLSQVEEEFINKVNSKIEIVQKGFYEDEVFGNSGFLPPKVGETTTYTISWQVKNYFNDMKDVQVKAILPHGVRLTGQIFPEEAADRFTFDSGSRELVWNVGDLLVGQGVLNLPPSIFFQVALTPDVSQKNQAAELISQVRITGQDQWTGINLENMDVGIDTLLPHDPSINVGDGLIQ